MGRSALIVLVVAVVALYSCQTAECQRQCAPDKVYNSCGTACPPTCKNPDPKACTLQCVIGCQCRPGLYTQPDGSCIRPWKCPK